MTLIDDVFPEIPVPKNMVREMSKKPCFRELLDREHGKSVDKKFSNMNDSTFKRLINHCEGSCIRKSLF